jgi:integrase
MNENMKTQTPIEAPSKPRGKPWKTIKGECRDVPIYRWESGGRTFYRVLIPGATPPHKTTSNKQTILDLAEALAGVPAHMGPTLSGVNPELVVKTAEAIKKLEPVLTPLGLSVHAGLDEYLQLKARTGKLALAGLFDGILTPDGTAGDGNGLVQRLAEVSAAIAKLAPVLTPLNISIGSGIEEYAAVKALAGSQDLRELFKQLLSRPWIEKSKTPLAQVVMEFLDAKEKETKVRPEYLKGLYYGLGGLVTFIEAEAGIGASVGSVTTEQLKGFVFSPKREARGNATYRTNVRTFFKWCQLNQYIDYGQPTPAERLAKIKLDEPEPRILTVAEARAMLTALDDPWCLLYLVLSIFTGIRHDELQRATFDLIKGGSVLDIPPEISKTRKRRIIPIQPALDAWLAPFYGRAGLVLPISNIQYKVRRFLEESDAPGLSDDWGRNWLRQSFCSYRLAQTGKVLETSQEDGHSAYVLERVYMKRSTPEAAGEFFALSPEACGKPDWYERVKTFLAGQPEVWKRRKSKRKPRKPIGGALLTPAVLGLPQVAQSAEPIAA